MDHEYKPAGFFKKLFSVSSQSLRNWADRGDIGFIRLHNTQGDRRYLVADVKRHLGVTDVVLNGNQRKTYLYTRVSSAKQKEDLGRQSDELQRLYPDGILIRDIGSGVNFQRRGLQTLLGKIYDGVVDKVVVMHKDRIARIGVELLEGIFKKFRVQLVVHCKGEDEYDIDDRHKDLISIITLFVAGHHGRRAAENRKRRREQNNEAGPSKTQKTTKVVGGTSSQD